jgi:MFS family permease
MNGAADTRSVLGAAAVWTALFAVTLDSAMIAVGVNLIGEQLRTSAVELVLVVTAYFLAFAFAVLLTPRIARDRGVRTTILLGLMAFATAAASALVVTKAGELIVVRAVLGLAGGLVIGSATLLGPGPFGPRGRRLVLMAWVAVASLANALGPLFGGVLLALFAWPALFLVTEPLLVLAFVTALLFIPNTRDWRSDPDVPRADRTIEYVPLVLASAAVGSLVFGLGVELQAASGFGPFETGLRLLPVVILFFAVRWTTRQLTRCVRPRRGIVAGLASLVTAVASIGSVATELSEPGLLSITLLAAAAAGIASGSMHPHEMTADMDGGAAGLLEESLEHLGMAVGAGLGVGLAIFPGPMAPPLA